MENELENVTEKFRNKQNVLGKGVEFMEYILNSSRKYSKEFGKGP